MKTHNNKADEVRKIDRNESEDDIIEFISTDIMRLENVRLNPDHTQMEYILLRMMKMLDGVSGEIDYGVHTLIHGSGVSKNLREAVGYLGRIVARRVNNGDSLEFHNLGVYDKEQFFVKLEDDCFESEDTLFDKAITSLSTAMSYAIA